MWSKFKLSKSKDTPSRPKTSKLNKMTREKILKTSSTTVRFQTTMRKHFNKHSRSSWMIWGRHRAGSWLGKGSKTCSQSSRALSFLLLIQVTITFWKLILVIQGLKLHFLIKRSLSLQYWSLLAYFLVLSRRIWRF